MAPSEKVKDLLLDVEFSDEISVFSPAHTRLTVSNFTRPMDNTERIVVSFKSNMYPNGIFRFFHVNNRINYAHANAHAVNFELGPKYSCHDQCVVDIGGYMSESENSTTTNIKLQFLNNDENNPQYVNRVKITSVPLHQVSFINIPLKELLFGLGVSLLSSTIVLFLTLNRDSKKIKL